MTRDNVHRTTVFPTTSDPQLAESAVIFFLYPKHMLLKNNMGKTSKNQHPPARYTDVFPQSPNTGINPSPV